MKLPQDVDLDPNLYLVEDSKVYNLKDGLVSLQEVWLSLNRMDGCALDNDADRLAVFKDIIEHAFLLDKREK